MHHLPVRRSVWSRQSADRIERLIAARDRATAGLPPHMGLR